MEVAVDKPGDVRASCHMDRMRAYKVRVLKTGHSVTVLWVALANSADQAVSLTISHLSAGDAVIDCEAII
jgi:hypothetical protein